jgi:ParB family chromosome partitioning protein
LNDAQASRTLAELHGRWQLRLPRQSAHLWSALLDHDYDSRAALFAYCVGCSVNAIVQSWDRRPGAMAHADRLAELVGLNMAAEGVWTPTVASYLGRVTKAQILAAVSEAKGEAAAEGIA